MKIWQITEAINAPIYQRGYQAVMAGVQQWVPEIMKTVDQYTYKAQFRDQLRQYPTEYSTENSGLWDRRANLRDEQYDREYTTLVHDENPALHELLVKSFKELIEQRLREAAISYIEEQFGKIEKIDPKEPYDDMKKKNLWFLQYLIVDLDTTATYKTGKPKTSGGYMQSLPNRDEFTDTWSKTNVDWKNDIGFGIKLYSSDNSVWLAAVGSIIESLHVEHFGEVQERQNGLPALLENILPTWVHEVIHAEQWIRRRVLDKNYYKYDMGMSYTPRVKKRPTVDRYNRNLEVTQRFKRGGTRGFPSHLTDIENANTAEWIEYYGTSHEIEAHAAGAAAHFMHEIVQDIEKNNYRDNENYKQEQINRAIDIIIEDISSGYIRTDIHSLKDYYNLIRQEAMRYLRLKAAKQDYDIGKDQRALNKVDIGARKVWTIFLSKLVKHLQSYKKPIKPSYGWDEKPPQYQLQHPAKKPTLPG